MVVGTLLVMALGCHDDAGVSALVEEPAVENLPELAVPMHADRFVQSAPPQVDVLWVIDNSDSMADEQHKLVDNMSSFAAFFEDTGIDWHMGVITTDMSDGGELRHVGAHRFVGPDVEEADQVFAAMALVGDDGDREERGRDAIFAALTSPMLHGYNGGFYRPAAELHIIVISDEDDVSEMPRDAFIDFLHHLKPEPDQVRLSAIVGPQGLDACHSAPAGYDYIHMAQRTGGLVRSICSEDWVPLMSDLGVASSDFEEVLYLSKTPVRSTIEVTVVDGDAEWAPGSIEWRYEPVPNAVILTDFIPPYHAETIVRYQLR